MFISEAVSCLYLNWPVATCLTLASSFAVWYTFLLFSLFKLHFIYWWWLSIRFCNSPYTSCCSRQCIPRFHRVAFSSLKSLLSLNPNNSVTHSLFMIGRCLPRILEAVSVTAVLYSAVDTVSNCSVALKISATCGSFSLSSLSLIPMTFSLLFFNLQAHLKRLDR